MVVQALTKDENKFLLLEGIHPSAVETLKSAGFNNIEYHKGALSKSELETALKDARFIGIRSRTHLTKDIIDAAPKLAGIGCFCIGTNQVELDAATVKGIPVFNAPFSNTRSVAELVLAEAILLLRRVPEANAKAHQGKWNKLATGSHEARGKNLGIIGYGHIGSQLSVLAESLGMNVYFYDIETKLPLGNAKQIPTMRELLAMSDIVSMHVPENPTTIKMISQPEIDMMKTGAILLNASRGTVIDIKALTQALETNKLNGAAIDVFPTEPATNNDPFESPLCKFDNVIITPHIGGSTSEAQENIGIEVATKLAKYSDTGATLSAVNFPEASLPIPAKGSSRFINIHHNQPGVLTAINTLFAEQGLNISAQYLQTDAKIGYVVIDIDRVEQNKAEELLIKLKSVTGTIRARLLF
ncbi:MULTISPECIES: phosphoglycerate dehydrogenase [Gilliamella]|jgi:Phosphoglycerate dehydrogenase and related dehydrogenases|uniref:D-3-phosphoglycerate dehydrogenase n=1 Tax=Gilliamella apis TaxID=1970738 RepID=A0A242NTI4_9GAMM|nr:MULTISPECIES: phosphoglycerate dehydrogenase [Gilliamella]MBI0113620.1 phosphoglycerate dehydrogenase [Gilliamella sp. W8123]MBI0117391.1 phosphoglycerate dehydrogenase [Gilliamella sp. W8129]OTQ35322.1 D-3-phosphoglycerate dehydrogenase [Gilliamella apis]OTQ37326.1 D-3-phosphoglycerate dehydrogenase [Gilliamella apis]OTQ40950.1 D-3-phosphoglycerate dehydrogenase [Gilliamella apis]